MQCLKTHKEVTDMKSACRLPLRVGRSGFWELLVHYQCLFLDLGDGYMDMCFSLTCFAMYLFRLISVSLYHFSYMIYFPILKKALRK